MTPDKKKVITDYLSGPRNYAEGVAIYMNYGCNLRLKKLFSFDDSCTTREILYDELRKIAGLSDAEVTRLPRRAISRASSNDSSDTRYVAKNKSRLAEDESALTELADSFGVCVDELVSPDFQERVCAMDENVDRIEVLTEELEEARSKYARTPEPVKKMIRFREKYPFLNSPDCPDSLKILVADMFTAYGNYKAAHERLQLLKDDEVAAAAMECETVITEYLKNREIWDELEYYRNNGAILGKAAKFRELQAAEDLASLSDVELLSKLQSAQSQESKQKKKVAVAASGNKTDEKAIAALETWSARKRELKAEVERRKKK